MTTRYSDPNGLENGPELEGRAGPEGSISTSHRKGRGPQSAGLSLGHARREAQHSAAITELRVNAEKNTPLRTGLYVHRPTR